jgi:aminopeptidase N
MRTETPPTIRLKDYTAPAHLISHVSLDVALDPTATRVVATSRVKPNPAGKQAGNTLELDGEELELKHISINGEEIGDNRYRIDGEKLFIEGVPDDEFELTIETVCNPDSQYRTVRPVPLQRRVLHPVRGRRFPPHYLVHRPAGCDGNL